MKASYSANSNFYGHWLKLSCDVPDESALDCRQCVMLKPPPGTKRDEGPFSEKLKCCTYFPFLPNFSIGAILEQGDASRHELLRKALHVGFLSPLGLFPTVSRQRSQAEIGKQGFGKEPGLLCPFFDSQRLQCGIWEFRPGVCQSYFCISREGQKGLDFWAKREEALNSFEWSLAHEVLWELGYTSDDVREMEEARMSGVSCPPGLWLDGGTERSDRQMEQIELRTQTFFPQAYRVAKALKPC
jgi:Fe-S-cluster containining protein